MNETKLQGVEWLLGLNLQERRPSREDRRSSATAEQLERGQSRLQSRKGEPPLVSSETFERKLCVEQISEAELILLLGESAEGLGERISTVPAWLGQFNEAYTSDLLDTGELVEEEQADGFQSLAQPLIALGRARMRSGIESLLREFPSAAFDAPHVESLLINNLLAQLPAMIDRTMVLELNVARLRGLLDGATSEERFQSFIRLLRDRETATALLQEYPVLARQLVICVEHWLEFSLEFLRRLCEDQASIRTTFFSDRDPGRLVDMSGGAGDGHARGRSVLIAQFECGARLVYKPKSVAVVRHFQELLTWLNQAGANPPLRTLAVLERGTHGWIEFVAHEGCTQAAEVERFYQRQGEYLALFYALEATDFHAENIIACGEHVFPIDLEALFHPRLESAAQSGVERRAAESIQQSVCRIGMLPDFIWGDDGAEGVDISGLGDISGQLSPYAVPDWDDSGTDGMHLIRRRMPMDGSRNRPKLNGADVEVLDYVGAIVVGFRQMYQLLLERREQLLAADGPIRRFRDDEVRVVLRPTRFYADLLSESFHPDLLRDAMDRDRIFDRLYGWLEREPYLAKVIVAELEDLNLGDIPIFSTRPDTCDLHDSRQRLISGVFTESGLELVERRLRQFSDADRELQVWYIYAAFAALTSDRGFVLPTTMPRGKPLVADRERLLREACRVGDHLAAQAIRQGDEATWVGLLNIKDKQWSISSLGLDLYNGLPGVAFFLAYLGDVSQDRRYTQLARSATSALLRQYAQSHVRWVGAFDGLGGVVYTLTHLGALWNDRQLLEQADRIIHTLPALIEGDSHWDVISGAAGCVGALLANYDHTGSSAALDAAVCCGERLLQRATPVGPGLGWVAPTLSSQPLTGFSHGVAGIAWALLGLAQRTGDERFNRTAHAGMEYERSLFLPSVGNWLDVRNASSAGSPTGESPAQHAAAWCHGAPGIGLARLQTLSTLDTVVVRREIDVALETTIASGFGHTPTLCHGDLGNIDFLLEAGEILGDLRWQAEAQRRATDVLAGIDANGWVCATPRGVESPGLMTGLAGIGYGLLRLAAPQRVPSVLSLTSPRLGTK